MIEEVKLITDPAVKPDHARPSLGRAKHVGITEASNKGQTPEAFKGGPAPGNIRHGYVPWFKACLVKGGSHLSVAVTALFPDDGNLRLAPACQYLGWGKLGAKVQAEIRPLSFINRPPFFINTFRIRLEPVNPVARLLPERPQGRHLFPHDLNAVTSDDHQWSLHGPADYLEGDFPFLKKSRNGILINVQVFKNKAQLFGEKQPQRLNPLLTDIYLYPAVPCKCHLQECGYKTTVAPVVT
ncbi:hypothetical protein BMS3Abin08_00957 [bacterium BMS3Abin08]|nr:hypothetical protein BMS3Abin08_00957 [bacterium BMS3Abin08]